MIRNSIFFVGLAVVLLGLFHPGSSAQVQVIEPPSSMPCEAVGVAISEHEQSIRCVDDYSMWCSQPCGISSGSNDTGTYTFCRCLEVGPMPDCCTLVLQTNGSFNTAGTCGAPGCPGSEGQECKLKVVYDLTTGHSEYSVACE